VYRNNNIEVEDSTPFLVWQLAPLGSGQIPAEQPSHSQVITTGRAIVGFISRKVKARKQHTDDGTRATGARSNTWALNKVETGGQNV
jgi:hypothetical protein